MFLGIRSLCVCLSLRACLEKIKKALTDFEVLCAFERRDGTKASVIEVIANHVEFLEPKGTREIPNEEVIFDDEPVIEEESKNLDTIDVADDDLPF